MGEGSGREWVRAVGETVNRRIVECTRVCGTDMMCVSHSISQLAAMIVLAIDFASFA